MKKKLKKIFFKEMYNIACRKFENAILNKPVNSLNQSGKSFDVFEKGFIKVLNNHMLLKKALRANHTPYMIKTRR